MSESGGAAAKGPGGAARAGNSVLRLLFKVFGPAQLGRRDEPPPDPDRPVPDPPCSLCGEPTSAHRIVNVSGRTHMRCPGDGA